VAAVSAPGRAFFAPTLWSLSPESKRKIRRQVVATPRMIGKKTQLRSSASIASKDFFQYCQSAEALRAAESEVISVPSRHLLHDENPCSVTGVPSQGLREAPVGVRGWLCFRRKPGENFRATGRPDFWKPSRCIPPFVIVPTATLGGRAGGSHEICGALVPFALIAVRLCYPWSLSVGLRSSCGSRSSASAHATTSAVRHSRGRSGLASGLGKSPSATARHMLRSLRLMMCASCSTRTNSGSGRAHQTMTARGPRHACSIRPGRSPRITRLFVCWVSAAAQARQLHPPCARQFDVARV
jgi:hypothetical protein